MTCPLMKGPPGCAWCGGELAGRRWRWCSDECSGANWFHHDWKAARRNAVERDGYTCVRCGYVGWSDVPPSVLSVSVHDHDLDPLGPNLDDWAVALGLLSAEESYHRYAGGGAHSAERRRRALSQLPDVIATLVEKERRPLWWASRHGLRLHQLEVNHIDPRRGRGYGGGCHNHPENLETLCRPCHVDETNRQRRGLPSWREDPRPITEIEGRAIQEALL